jgi:site-specific recombinase XerD
MKPEPRTFQVLVRDFLEQHLGIERNASPNTVKSYRDALKLFVTYAGTAHACSPDKLTFDALGPDTVGGFLVWLQSERGSSASTRNQRLAALKSFVRYVAAVDPRHLERCRAIRELSNARTAHAEPEYLDEDEMHQLIRAPQGTARERDHALLILLYNTGARVQEIVDLNVGDIRDGPLPSVVLRGKGARQRTCPLWTRTIVAVQRWLRTRKDVGPDSPLFPNARGHRITRSGVSYVLARAASNARLQPRHAKRVTPHVIRHATAMQLLQSGVDITTIAAWLGHAQLKTTHGYVQVSLRMKRAALAGEAAPPELSGGTYPTDSLIDWLEAIGRRSIMRSKPPQSLVTTNDSEPDST